MLFRKKNTSTNSIVFLNEVYPLSCDPQLLEQELNRIYLLMILWRSNEMEIKEKVKGLQDNPFSEYLRTRVDLINIAHDVPFFTFKRMIDDPDERNKVLLRWLETVMQITMTIDFTVIQTLKGRFIYSVINQFVAPPGKESDRPTIEQWERCFREIPWIWMISFYQQAMTFASQREELKKLLRIDDLSLKESRIL